jgi:hypothetical protein
MSSKTKNNQKSKEESSISIEKQIYSEDLNAEVLSSVFEAFKKIENRINESENPIEFRFLKRESFTFAIKEKKTFGLYQSDMYRNIRLKTVWNDLDGNEIKIMEVVKKGSIYYRVYDNEYETVEKLPNGIMTPLLLFKYMEKTVGTDKQLRFSKETTAYVGKDNGILLADSIEYSKKESMTTVKIDIYKTVWENDLGKFELFIYVNKETDQIACGRFFYSVEDLDTDYVIEFKIKKLAQDFSITVFK